MSLSQVTKKRHKADIEIDSDSDYADDTPLPIPAVQTVKGALEHSRLRGEAVVYERVIVYSIMIWSVGHCFSGFVPLKIDE